MNTKLLFGVHMHQPVDNLSQSVEKAVKDCYAPFFKILSKYPQFKFALHSSGWILEHIKNNYPDTFKDIKKCNIEFFTGGFYEPILTSIDKDSQIAQIKKLNEFIYKHFNQHPRGLWLTERVWDNSIISSLTKSDLLYTIVDDYHLYSCGIHDTEGFYTTEEGGNVLSLFAINKDLRYKIPFSKSHEAVDEIKKLKCAIIFDDLEKFGLWPKTYEWVYEQKWLEEFIQKILAKDEIETIYFSEFYEQNSSKGLIYPQNVSYLEMNEWSLKKDNIKKYKYYDNLMKNDSVQFLRGGIWKNFFIKYSESNRIHKRMLEFTSLQNDLLYKLQTNDVLWHGAFGGIYLPNLRDNAYRYLIQCDKNQKIQIKDVELQGYKQIKVPTKSMIFRFCAKGGSLIEFDDRQNFLNYQNTLTRREEFYHEDMLTCKEDTQSTKDIQTIHNIKHNIDDNIKNQLFFDRYEKISFIDFISDDFTLDRFMANNFNIIKNFSQEIFKQKVDNKTIMFSQTQLIKQYYILQNGFLFNIKLNFKGSFTYILELNLHFAHYDDLSINDMIVQDKGVLQTGQFIFRDNFGKRDIVITFDKEIKLNYFLIKTFSQNESGIDSIIQGISLAFEIDFCDNADIKGKIVCQR